MTADTDAPGRRWHDMGGRPAGTVHRREHDHALWEKRVDALKEICGRKGLISVDALRRVLEDMGEQAFEEMSYYERWMASITENLVESGAFTAAELSARMEEVARRGPTYGEAQGHAE